MLIPFVEKGNRAQRFLTTMAELDRVRGEKDFFIFLADRLSYEEMRASNSDPGAAGRPAPSAASPAAGGMFSVVSLEEARRNRDANVLNAILADETPLLTSMVVAGHIPYQVEGRFGPMLVMVDKLNQGSVFKGVDDISQDRQIEEQIFNLWERFWREKPSKGRFTRFMFNLPFAQRDVTLPAATAEKGTKTK
jgi:hypothetical protein